MQVLVNANKISSMAELGEDDLLSAFKSNIADPCHRGAFIGVSGRPGVSDTGEYSVMAHDVCILAATEQNLPMMNWNKNMLKDGEKRFAQRYLDLIVNSQLKTHF